MQDNYLGFGLGLRIEHYDHIVKNKPDIDWFEALSENYMVAGGKPRHYLQKIREHYPIVLHGVSLSIGSTDPLDKQYLKNLKQLIQEVQPAWVSDHLCWTSIGGINSHDLLPLPYTQSTLDYVSSRVLEVQDFLGREILLENVSSYVSYAESEMSEWDFIRGLSRQCGCKLLLDVNNIYVSARNHGFDPDEFIHGIDLGTVQQIHLAGHSDLGDYVIDTHDHPVRDEVWQLYRRALQRFGNISTMIERDDHIPPFIELEAELAQARAIATELEIERAAAA